jgi:broad specificity phosphatase PhoE
MHEMFVVTHPAADHHDRGLVGGWYDSHLTAAGRDAAGAVADELAARRADNDRPVRVITSDLARCVETADVIALRLGVRAEPDRRLRETSFGEAEGRPDAWLDERQVPAPDHDRLDHRGPVAGAETRREVASRVAACVEELIADVEHDHVVVTHGYAQTFVVTTWLRLPVESVGFASFATSPGAITHLRLDDYWRNRAVVSLASTEHLRSGHL